MSLGFVSLTSPLMLWGAAAASLPVLAHLLNRRTRWSFTFPTIRLLRESVTSQSKLFRLRRWIMLALRCLIILLMVLAFTRPVWTEKGAKPVAPGKGASVILLLDLSASAAQQSEGISVINSMRAMAGRTLNSLQNGTDRVNIVYASSKPKKAFPEVSNNFAAVREELRHIEPTQERADLAEAIALAGQVLHDQGGQRRLVILSDMQRTNWSDVTFQEQAGTLLPKGTQVTILPVSGGKVANTALGEPRAFPVQPIVGQPLHLQVHVTNYADTERTVKVSSAVDGRATGSQEVTLKPWEGADIDFETKLNKPGHHEVVFFR